ncbi:AAA family ATPase [Oceanobacillus neutriphilus]|uniref:CRISPR-associated endoribonuclease Cas2 n=1 Tax=Oceanobacillus neutriphilus TaxID=531815 RepID=A0ABQ2NS90_9BACI|nr:AAA family ATPase [Oceanobacillus neutriphilus]GGP08607.1 CRISPR-associated endoribonuclease Cas2 [Oceanobacillus neutriphilus]
MKRLAVITVGKTHSGKSTFARDLEKELENSIVLDQDNHAEFINMYYQKLQPETGPNTLKHSITTLIGDYAIERTDLHIIACSANRTRKGRKYLLEEIYDKENFIRILVHFDIPDEILKERVINSTRNTNIFRGAYSNFEQVLIRQQVESSHDDIVDPEKGEADYLFVIKDNKEVDSIIAEIVSISEHL